MEKVRNAFLPLAPATHVFTKGNAEISSISGLSVVLASRIDMANSAS